MIQFLMQVDLSRLFFKYLEYDDTITNNRYHVTGMNKQRVETTEWLDSMGVRLKILINKIDNFK